MEEKVFGVFAFLFGTIIGSFANACIYRMPRDLSLSARRSMCTRCGVTIRAYDNIPILSYMLLRGRCRNCFTSYGLKYPLVEFATGLMAWWVFQKHGASIASVYFFLLAAALLIASGIDFEHRIIPDVISLGGLVLGLILASLTTWLGLEWPVTFMEAMLGVVAGAGILWGIGFLYEKLTGREGIGFGDVKLLALFGAHVGAAGVFTALLYGSLLGSIAGMSMVALGRAGRRYPIPFGPFLCLGLLVHVLWGGHAITRPIRWIESIF